jgi:3-dehydroquinate dehydratase-2
MSFRVINGPNLNTLGERNQAIYGTLTLLEIEEKIRCLANDLGVEVLFFQSNNEGDIIDYIQRRGTDVQGIIINPGALTHYGLSLRDALIDVQIPVIEVHLSNIYSREEFRRHSVITPVVRGQLTGLGWRGYTAALELLVDIVKEKP